MLIFPAAAHFETQPLNARALPLSVFFVFFFMLVSFFRLETIAAFSRREMQICECLAQEIAGSGEELNESCRVQN